MSASPHAEEVPVRDAATVVILRDGAAGIETFMLRRNRRTVFGPGAHVFPGGAVDADDSGPVAQLCDGLDDARASRRLGIEAGGLSFWIAAIRECFEEAGVLIATDEQGCELAPDRDLGAQRDALNAGTRSLADICREERLRLPLDRIVYYGHWITPAGEPRRFSTRFFACPAPPGQGAAHDGNETVAGCWVRPREALARFEADGFPMMPPTVLQLRFLADYQRVEAVMAVLRGIHRVPTISPRLVGEGKRMRVVLASGCHGR